MKSLRLFVREAGWTEIENGPLPITPEQLVEARAKFAAEYYKAAHLHGAKHAPQTASRAILSEVAPQLSDFDRLMVGFAVSNPTVKYQVDEEGGETKTLVRHGGPGDSSKNDPMA